MSRLMSFNPEPFAGEVGFGPTIVNRALGETELEFGESELQGENEFRGRGRGRSFTPRFPKRPPSAHRSARRSGYGAFPFYRYDTGAPIFPIMEPSFAWPAYPAIADVDPDAEPANWRDPEQENAGARVAKASPTRPSGAAGAWATQLAPLLDRHRGAIPLEFLLGWISVESGGNIKDVTRLDERGYFQIHPEESRLLKLDHKRLSEDPEYSAAAGVRLVQHYAKRAQALGFTPGTDLFWHVVKLFHWLPKGLVATIGLMKKTGFHAANWEQFRGYMLAHRNELLKLIVGKAGTGWDPAVGIRNVEALFERGRALAALVGGGASSASVRSGVVTRPTPMDQTTIDSAAFRRRVVQIAMDELAKWGDGSVKEAEPRIAGILQKYWKTGLGVSVSKAQLADPAFEAAHPWSGAFISYVMRTAGAGRLFKYSGYHSTYTRAAIDNRLANNANPFKAYRISEVAPQLGDIVVKSRGPVVSTYDNVKSGVQGHGDIVTEVRPGSIVVVGGNVANSVKRSVIKTDAAGRIIAAPPYYAVIRVGGATPAPAPSPGPAPGPRPQPSGNAPALLKSETTPKGLTLYLDINLKIVDKFGIAAQPVTGVFIPEGYTPGGSVDIVLWLHGHKAESLRKSAIDKYWDAKRFAYGAFREGVNASGRNVILVAPTLGGHSEPGLLTKPGGLDAFLASVLAAMRAYGPHRGAMADPALGNLILACHSGGGAPMLALARGKNRVAAQIRECWGYDCLYNAGSDALWADWARSRPGAKLYIYYIKGSPTAPLSEALQKHGVANAIVAPARDRRHNFVPITHWLERLSGAPFLAPRAGGVVPPKPAPGPAPTPSPAPGPTPPSGLKGMTQAQFIEFVGALARNAMAATGVPASVTVAQAIVESGWGKHTIGAAKNLFGIKGRGPAGTIRAKTKEVVNGKEVVIEANFAKYDSFEQSVAEHARLFLCKRRYARALDVKNNADAFARAIAAAGYATAPNYGETLIRYMRRHDLYRFDR
jgi:hypothetical protein